jgi:phosphatidylglycerophosphate synthase
VIWLLADSLDGMVARARGTSSAFGRELDGFCDHGVFLLLYLALAWPTREGVAWSLVVGAATAHIMPGEPV